MLSKAVFIHCHINLAYKTPLIIRDLRSRTITAAISEKCSTCSICNTAVTGILFTSKLIVVDAVWSFVELVKSSKAL